MACERPPAGRFAPRLSPSRGGQLVTPVPAPAVLLEVSNCFTEGQEATTVPLERGTAVERSDRQGVAHKPCLIRRSPISDLESRTCNAGIVRFSICFQPCSFASGSSF